MLRQSAVMRPAEPSQFLGELFGPSLGVAPKLHVMPQGHLYVLGVRHNLVVAGLIAPRAIMTPHPHSIADLMPTDG